MLQIQVLRDQREKAIEGLLKRGITNPDELIAAVLMHDDRRKQSQQKMDDLKANSNSLSRQIGELMKAGKAEEAAKLREEVSQAKDSVKQLEAEMEEASASLTKALYQIPNVPHQKVPKGHGAQENLEVNKWGAIPELTADALPQWELIKKYDIIDFDLGIKISGAGFPVYKGKGAKLQRALINFFLDEATKAGYREIQPPIVINEASGYGTGQLPDKESQMYHITADNLFLIPTAEVPITNLYRDVILSDKELPIMNVGYTPCFRREAGSWGAHVRGLNRLHQFDKVEIVQIRKPSESMEVLEQMTKYVESLLEKLELPFRRMLLCGGDMGFNSAITYDLEVYSAAQKMWLEVSSVSNFETYQANRLKLRYKNSDGKTELLHTLNGSALALPRIVAAMLENNQKSGYISIPKVLLPYTGFDRID